ncbi:MAG: DUF192 domain-containing protein [Desulfobacterales bacterium]|nr:DUF192 domain-containing protein [Desulfobacterales bacterium]
MGAAVDRFATGRRRIGRLGLAAALVLLLLPAAPRAETHVCGQSARSRVTVQREGRVIAAFTVAVAASVAERSRGLMHCPVLGPGTGMLFVYADARPRVFWMKDTPLDLGIVFIDAQSRIAAIARGWPQSLARIHSPGPARFVLEINYDEAAALRVGDLVNRTAAGPEIETRPSHKE